MCIYNQPSYSDCTQHTKKKFIFNVKNNTREDAADDNDDASERDFAFFISRMRC